jgi:hypothetical protein
MTDKEVRDIVGVFVHGGDRLANLKTINDVIRVSFALGAEKAALVCEARQQGVA